MQVVISLLVLFNFSLALRFNLLGVLLRAVVHS